MGVFFYGGGFSQGGSSTFNGSSLVANHGVIIVTVNYRLGALGFAAIPWRDGQRAGVGNFGLMDQQSALRWVQRNAETFGGDSAKVTIFGQSAGAASVDAHLLMPSSRGLFARAILESGGLNSISPLEFSLNVTRSLCKRLNCTQSDAHAIKCLRQRSVASILAAQGPASGPSTAGNPALECATAKGCRSFHPTVDGTLLQGTAFELTSQGLINKDVDIMAGTNTN